MYDITASIVTYCNEPTILMNAVSSFLDTELNVRLFISDNSPDQTLKEIIDDDRIEYVFNNENLGFGKGHNKIINLILFATEFHLVLNPDVFFSKNVIPDLLSYLKSDSDVGLISPKILYPDQTVQHSCRLIPNPADMIIRRVPFLQNIFRERVENSEMLFTGYNKKMIVPFVLGAFQLFRTETFKKVGLFDERFFMYMEDLDMSRRVNNHYKVLFYPDVYIYHHYEKGSSKEKHLLKLHIASMIKYFKKWGWVKDSNKKLINERAIEYYRNSTAQK